MQLAVDMLGPPSHIAEYEIVRELGQGSMGTVYLAWQPVPRKLVALKVLRDDLCDERGIRWFAEEIEILGRLEHPNVVSIYDGKGLHHRPAFFVMRWVDGRTLGDPELRARFREPVAATRLLFKIADAIQFAHQRGVLHRDLKPSNLLIDQHDEPYVSDFGLARLLNTSDCVEPMSQIAGSLGYMSPEQASPSQQGLTVASDVYALGAILYELLTGAPPRQADTLASLVAAFESEPLVSPRARNPKVPEDLAQVCLSALQLDPTRRHRSAAELADDLRRVLAQEPPRLPNSPRPSQVVRLSYWSRRHRLSVISWAVLLSGLLGMAPQACFTVDDLKRQIREHNVALAGAQAGAVMNELQQLAKRAAAIAHDPALVALVEWPDVYTPPAVLAERLGPFDMITVFTPAGDLLARFPKPTIERYPFLNYAFRDYFAGQANLDPRAHEEVYISRAFFSTGDRKLQFGFAAPVYDATGRQVAVIMAGVSARSTFGSVRMDPGSGMTALLGARDRDDASQPIPQRLSVLAAPGLDVGSDTLVDEQSSQQLCRSLHCEPEQHQQLQLRSGDQPVLYESFPHPTTQEPAVSAFAAVGRTGLIVQVSTPHSFLAGVQANMRARVLTWTVLSCAALLALAWWLSSRSSRRVLRS